MSDLIFREQYKEVMDVAYLDALSKDDDHRIIEQRKQHQYYSGAWNSIRAYLKAALDVVWRDYTVKRMPKSYLNLVAKIIKSVSMIYVQAPKRRIYIDGKLNDDLTKYFNSILSKTINKYDKQTHRMGKLHNTAVPVISFDKGKFSQRVGSSWLYTVYTDLADFDTIIKFTYNKYFYNGEGRMELYTVVWTDEEHYLLDALGNKSTVPGMENTTNPYGIIPVPYLRFDDPENDFWGEGQNVLVNESEQINLLLSKLNYDDIIMGTAGMLFGVNLGEIKTNSNEDGDTVITGGRDAIIQATTKQGEKQTTSLEYVSTNPQIEEVRMAIDWKIKVIAMSLGLNPNNFSVETKAESGYSRLVASFEQGEVRQDDIDACKEYEDRRFDIIRTMNNELAKSDFKGTEKLKTIPENAEIVVDFLEIKPTLSGQDLWTDRAEREKRNLGTPAKWLMEDNPDVRTIEEALEIITDNKDINDQLGTKEISTEGDGRNTNAATATGKQIGEGMKPDEE